MREYEVPDVTRTELAGRDTRKLAIICWSPLSPKSKRLHIVWKPSFLQLVETTLIV